MKKDLFNNIFTGKRVLVTGDTGFKGSWLCVWLSTLGAEVFGLALPPKSKQDNFVRARIGAVIKHTDCDVRDFSAVNKLFATIRPHIVFHLAAQPLVIESYKSPFDTFSTNVLGTLTILESARLCSGVKAIVNVTTDKCYLNREWVHGYRETDALGGNDPYSASKAASEIVSGAYSHSFFSGKSSAVIATARAGNVIGGGDWAHNRIVPDCIRALRSKKSIVLRNPYSTRPWQHVLEPLRGYLMLAQMLYSQGTRWSGPWNFGPLQVNIRPVEALATQVVKEWGEGKITVQKTGARPHEAMNLNLDISKVLTVLKWRPVLDFKETIAWTVQEYRAMQGAKNVFDVMAGEISRFSDKVNDDNNDEGRI